VAVGKTRGLNIEIRIGDKSGLVAAPVDAAMREE
jgi:hypothetical protein